MSFVYPGGPKQGCFLVVGRDACRLQVRHEPAIEVVADGDFALLASLFPEPQDALCALVLEVAAAEAGEGADPGSGIARVPRRARSRRPTTWERSIEARRSRAAGWRFGCFAVDHGVFFAPHGGERVQRHGMTSHQGIEEVAQAARA